MGNGEWEKLAAYLPIARQVDLEGLGVVLEAQRGHGKQNVLAIDCLALLLLAFFGSYEKGFVSCGGKDLAGGLLGKGRTCLRS